MSAVFGRVCKVAKSADLGLSYLSTRLPVWLSIHMEQLISYWTDFHDI
jgi:hypothetical protein